MKQKWNDMKKKTWSKKKANKALDVAMIFCVIGTLANFEIISSSSDTVNFILKQLMYIGIFIIAICAINYNRIK